MTDAKAPLTFTRDELREQTDSRSWERGVRYHQRGLVVELREDGDRAFARVEGTFARVEGTHLYSVELWRAGGRLVGACSCPMGDAGVFCKHCVATGLTYLKGPPDAARDDDGAVGAASPHVSFDDVRAYLETWEPTALAELIIRQAEHDDALRRELVTKTALFGVDTLGVAAFRQAIDEATATGQFVDYREAYAFAQGIHRVIASIEELLSAGDAAEAVELVEYALRRVEQALGNVDDSDGEMGYVLDCLVDLHHRACIVAKPDAEFLAEMLFEWGLTSDWGTFSGAVAVYADVLGERGLAVYRRLATEEWERLGPPKGRGEDRSVQHRRRWCQSVLESLARAEGDIEALVALKSRDLSAPHDYLAIAEIYRKARQRNKAMGGPSRACASSSPTSTTAAVATTRPWPSSGRTSPTAPAWTATRRSSSMASRQAHGRRGGSGHSRTFVRASPARGKRGFPRTFSLPSPSIVRCSSASSCGRRTWRRPGPRRRRVAARRRYGWNWPSSARPTTRPTLSPSTSARSNS